MLEKKAKAAVLMWKINEEGKQKFIRWKKKLKKK
jgi:hypothetical protein